MEMELASKKKKIVTVNFSCALFPLMCIHDNLAMQGLVWLNMVRFRVIRFGVSYTNLRRPHIFKHQIQGKNLVFHSSKYGMCSVNIYHIKVWEMLFYTISFIA
jgi:hypothetical protein